MVATSWSRVTPSGRDGCQPSRIICRTSSRSGARAEGPNAHSGVGPKDRAHPRPDSRGGGEHVDPDGSGRKDRQAGPPPTEGVVPCHVIVVPGPQMVLSPCIEEPCPVVRRLSGQDVSRIRRTLHRQGDAPATLRVGDRERVADDEQACTHLVNILSAKDWQTDKAWIGSKALELARSNTYDAIVFDYQKPGLDGAEVCRLIREAQPEARHVFVTGTPDIETVYHAMVAGADRVLAKPIDPTELIHVLEEQLVGSA